MQSSYGKHTSIYSCALLGADDCAYLRLKMKVRLSYFSYFLSHLYVVFDACI